MGDSVELVKKIIQGDSHKFYDLIEENKRLVYNIVGRMVANRADREDICQDVFVKVYRNLGSFHFESKLSTWIARIAFNTCFNYLKKKKVPLFDDNAPDGETVQSALLDFAATPEQAAVKGDIARRVQSEVENLSPHYRTIVILYHLEEMSYAEIAGIMDLPAGTVKSYLFRARQQLKKRISEKYVEAELWQD